jgi:hypothetical protein
MQSMFPALQKHSVTGSFSHSVKILFYGEICPVSSPGLSMNIRKIVTLGKNYF